MKIACIDLEGVLAPEIWPFVADETGIEELSITTREEPNYPALMERRIAALRRHGLTLKKLQSIVRRLQPFSDAAAFLTVLGERYQVQIVSDCFYELADHLLLALGSPRALCHQFVLDRAGFIVNCAFAARRGKEDVVIELLRSGAHVLAVGDALNDLAMLRLATHGFLIRPSHATRVAGHDIAVVSRLAEIMDVVRDE